MLAPSIGVHLQLCFPTHPCVSSGTKQRPGASGRETQGEGEGEIERARLKEGERSKGDPAQATSPIQAAARAPAGLCVRLRAGGLGGEGERAGGRKGRDG